MLALGGPWPAGLVRGVQGLFDHNHEVVDAHRFLKRRDSPDLEGFALHLLGITSGHDYDGNGREQLVCLEAFEDHESITTRHFNIKQNDVGPPLARRADRLNEVGSADHSHVSRSQLCADQEPRLWVIVDDQ